MIKGHDVPIDADPSSILRDGKMKKANFTQRTPYYSQEREALLEESVALEEMLEDLFQWVSTAVASFFEIF